MQHTANKTPLKTFVILLFTPLLLTSMQVHAQQLKDTVYTSQQAMASAKTQNDTGSVIASFKQLNMPPEMMAHFTQITPDNIAALEDELQVTANDEDGDAVILTTKLRFYHNSIVGYIKEAPLEKTTEATVSEYSVNIPVEWVCSPTNKKHGQHYVSTLTAVKMAEYQYKCKDWHIKL